MQIEEQSGLEVEWVSVDDIKPYDNNPRENKLAIPKVAESIRRYGWRQPIVVDEKSVIVVGDTRWRAAKLLGEIQVPVHRAVGLSPEKAASYRIADNRVGAEAVFDQKRLAEELRKLQPTPEALQSMGFDPAEGESLLREKLSKSYRDWKAGALSEDFGAPPLSVLDARQGYWQARKKWWAGQIGDLARKTRGNLQTGSGVYADAGPTSSILDAFLCELMCLWFARPDFAVYNPFAGGVQFGFVAATMGLKFTGVEIRQDQTDANNALLTKFGLEGQYICGDACVKHVKPNSQDMIFSCPPYADLEVYSSDPRDISNMPFEQFEQKLRESLVEAAKALRKNRFAVIVIGEAREKGKGLYGVVPATVSAMQAAGLSYWNDMVLVTPSSNNAGLRARGMFTRGRVVPRVHQHVLAFYKGDPKEIRSIFPEKPKGKGKKSK